MMIACHHNLNHFMYNYQILYTIIPHTVIDMCVCKSVILISPEPLKVKCTCTHNTTISQICTL